MEYNVSRMECYAVNTKKPVKTSYFWDKYSEDEQSLLVAVSTKLEYLQTF